jgi:hypothetical protein
VPIVVTLITMGSLLSGCGVKKRDLTNELTTTYTQWVEKNCGKSEFSDNKEIFRRMIEDPGHGDHFHLRLKCTAHNPHCVGRDALFPTTGCVGFKSKTTRFRSTSESKGSNKCSIKF